MSDRRELYALLDEASVAHVAVAHSSGPLVLPMAYGRIGDHLYLHGAAKNGLLRSALDQDVCVTVTLVDGWVLAKSAFRHSANFRSAVVRGRATEVEGDEKAAALVAITDHLIPGRMSECRPPTTAELKATLVVRVPLDEASVKARRGGPTLAAEDEGFDVWSGVLPFEQSLGPVATDEPMPPPSVIAAALAQAPRLPGGGVVAGTYGLDPDPRRLELSRVLAWLRDESYWASDLNLGRLLRSIQGSFVVGAYTAAGEQVGFARAVTDRETFGWLADVFVDREHRGHGLGRALARFLVEHPDLGRLRKWLLGTRDAQAMYQAMGFEPVPEGWYLLRNAKTS